MGKRLLVIWLLFPLLIKAQTFNGTGGAIPDNGPSTCFPISVSGVGNISGSYGLAQVCLNINHTWDGDLEIVLTSPNGTQILLSSLNGGSGNNYTGTCFSANATNPITGGTAPFSGTYLPEGYLGSANNGQNADGVWNLCIQDQTTNDVGSLLNWSITFNNAPAPPVPSCSGNAPAGNSCLQATPVCNFNGFCGNTSSAYTIDSWTELDNVFCGLIDNNSFVSFVASSSSASFNVFVTNSLYGDGIQMMFYDGGCGSGAVTSYGCNSQIFPGGGPTLVTANGLIPGNTYYLMIDGFAGDVCDYIISAASGVNILSINPTNPVICLGNSIVLNASGGNGVYDWSPAAGLSSTSGSSVTASPQTTTTYALTSGSSGGCPLSTQVTVTVVPYPSLGNDSSIVLCSGKTINLNSLYNTSGLTANWTVGGTPVANPSSVGTSGLYQLVVRNMYGCADTALVNLTVNPKPALGADQLLNICTGTVANLNGPFNLLGLTPDWTLNGNVISNPSNVNTAGIYQLIATNLQGCKDTAMLNLGYVNPPNVGPDKSLVVCSGLPTNLTNAFNTSGLTTVWTLGGVSVANPASVTAAGIYQVIATNTTGCKDTALVTVTLSNKPYLGNDTSISICSGNSVQLAALYNTSGYSTIWTNSANQTVFLTAVTTADTYQLIAGNSNCTDTVLVTIQTFPKPGLGPDKSDVICRKLFVNLDTVFNATGFSSQWYLNGQTVANPSAVYQNGNYVLVAVNNAGCSDTAVFNLTVHPIPILGDDTTLHICSGSGANLNTVYNIGTYNNTFFFGGMAVVDPSNITAAGVYELISSNIVGCTDTAFITIEVDPVLNLGPDKIVNICTGSSVNLTTLFSVSGLMTEWTTNGNPVVVPQNITAPGLYQLIAGNGNACLDTALVSLSIFPPPVIGADTTVALCQGSFVDLTMVYNTAFLGTVWETAAGGPVLNPANINYSDVFNLIVSNGVGCKDTAQITVVFTPKPNLGPDKFFTICPGSPANLLVAYPTGGWVSVWTFNGVQVVTPGAVYVPGIYQLVVSNGVGCYDTALANINFNLKPNLGPDRTTTLCFGDPVNMNGYFNVSSLVPYWTTGGNPVANPSNVLVAGSYQLIATNSLGCTDTANLVINHNPKPNIGPDTTIYLCPGNTANLYNYYPLTGLSVNFSSAGVAYPNTTSINQSGNYLLLVSTSQGCRDTAWINIIQVPKPNIGNDKRIDICPGSFLDLTSQFNTVGLSSSWTIGGIPVPDPTQVNTTGTYQLIVANVGGCKDTAYLDLTVTNSLSLGPDKTIPLCPGFSADLTTQYNTLGLPQVWTVAGTSVSNPAAVYSAGIYHLEVSNASGCSGSADVTVIINPKPQLGNDTLINICYRNSINLYQVYDTLGYSHQWTFNAGTPLPTPSVVNSSGVFQLIVRNAFGCADTARVTTIIRALPSIGNDTALIRCQGTNTNLTVLYNTSGLISNWTSGGVAVVNPNSIGTSGIYQLIVRNSYGCPDTAIVNLAVLPKPQLGADTTIPICGGIATNLVNQYNTTGFQSDWTFGGIPFNAPDSIVNPGIYQLIAGDGLYCFDTVKVNLIAVPKPNLGPDKSLNICPGSSIGLTPQFNTTGLTTQWTLAGNPIANPSSVNQGGNYQLIATNVGGCSDTAVVAVSVQPKPALGLDKKIITCSGQLIDLTSQFNTSGFTNLWTYGGLPFTQPTNVTVSGVYQLIATNTLGCSDTALVTVIINPTPSAGRDTAINICQYNAANIGQWYNAGSNSSQWLYGGLPVLDSSQVYSAGTYLYVVITPQGCKDTALINIGYLPKPIVGSDLQAQICPGFPINLSGFFDTVQLAQQWQFQSAGIPIPTFVVRPGNYQYIGINQVGCSDTAVVQLIEFAKPAIGADQQSNICDGFSYNLNQAFDTTGLNVIWTLAGTPVVHPDSIATGGLYTIEVTNQNGCKDTANIQIQVQSAPFVGSDTSISICEGIFIDLNSVYPLSGYSSQWSLLGSPLANVSQIDIPGDYQVIITNGFGCSDTLHVQIAVVLNPVLGIDQVVRICPGTSTDLTAVFTTSGLTSQWRFGGSNIADPVAASIAGNYELIATNSTGCSDTAVVQLQINPAPQLGNDTAVAVCPGFTVDLNGLYNSNGYTINWTLSGNPVSNPSQVGVAGNYQLIASNGPGCTDTAVVAVSLHPVPQLGNDTVVAICPGTSIDLTTLYNTSSLTTQWTSAGNPIANPSQISLAGTYQLIATNATGCSDTAIVILNYHPVPALGIDQVVRICPGTSTDLTAVFTTSGLTSQWRFGGLNIADPVAVSTAGNYQLIATNSTGCSDTAVVQLQINPAPQLGNDTAVAVCPGFTVDLNGLYNSNGYTINWTLIGNPVSNPTQVGAAGNYQLIASNGPGCTDTAVVAVSLHPVPQLGNDTVVAICPGTSIDLTTLYNTSSLTTQWTSAGNPIANPSQISLAGTYQLIATNATGCSDTATVILNYHPVPVLGIDQVVRICPGTSTDLTSVFATSGLTSQWRFGGLNIADPVAASITGNYELIATNSTGCSDTAVVQLQINPAPQLGNDTAVSVCPGFTIDLNALYNSNGYTINWTLSGNPVSNPSQVGVAGNYQLIASNGPGCTDTALVVVNLHPVPQLGNDTSVAICPGTNIDLTTLYNTSSLTTQWTSAGNPIANPSQISLAGTYQLIATNATGCSDTATVILNYHPVPVLGIDQVVRICPGTSTDLTSVFTTSGLTSQWRFGGLNIADPVAASIAGNYELIATNSTGCSDTAVVQLQINPVPQLGNDTLVAVCPGFTVDLNGLYNSNGYTINWTINSNPVLNPTQVGVAGNYQLIASNGPGCTDTAVVAVSLHPVPQLGNDTVVAICPGTSIDLTSIYNTSTLTTQWSSAGNPVANPSQISLAGTYQLIATNATGCSDTATVILNYHPVPALGIDQVVRICQGTSTDLTSVFATSGLTSQWRFGGLNIADPVAASITGNYELIATNSTGCSDTAVVQLQFLSKPNLGNDTTIIFCPGFAVNLSTLYLTNGLSTQWQYQLSPILNVTSIDQPGTYQLVVTNTFGCTDTALVSVVQLVKPNVGNDVQLSICSGNSINATGYFNTIGLLSQWSEGGNPLTNPLQVNQAGNYQLIVANTAGCADTAYLNLTLLPKPALGNDKTITVCPGSSVDLSILYDTSNLTVQWTHVGVTVSDPSVVVDSGHYLIIVINAQGCSDTANVQINYHSVPQLGADVAVGICPGTSINLNPLFITTGWVSSWSSNGNMVSNPASVNLPGTYQLVVTNVNGCTDTAQVQLFLRPKPALGVDQQREICVGNIVDLTGIYATGGLATQWTINGNPVNNPAVVSLSGNYQLIAQNTFGCSDTSMVQVVVHPLPLLVVNPPADVCFPSTVDLTNPTITIGSTTGLTLTYWQDAGATISYPAAANAGNGTYYIQGTDARGCSSIRPVQAIVHPIPFANAGADTTVCFGTPALLHGTVNAPGAVNQFEWSPSNYLASPNNAITLATMPSTTNFLLNVTVQYPGCGFQVADQIKVIVLPEINAYAGNDSNAVYGLPHQLTAAGGIRYEWEPAGYLNNPYISHPTATLFNDQRFIVKAFNREGCYDTDTVFLKVYKGPTYYVPNSFTPNGDGSNDVFRPIPVGIVATDYFRIFNRYGELMFETNRFMEGWDGRFKGEDQPLGNYVWLLQGRDRNGKVIQMKGNVVLVR